MEELLELDAMGLLPLEGEAARAFKRRGARTLRSYADPQWRTEFIQQAIAHNNRLNAFHAVRIAGDRRKVRRFRDGIAALGQAVGADLSWIPIIEYWQSEFEPNSKYPYTVVAFAGELTRETGYYLPYLGINVGLTIGSPFDSGSHEAFHALRRPLDRTGQHAAAFDHLGSYVISPVKRWLPLHASGRKFRSAWIRLRWAFGKDAAYVLARMAYNELDNPVIMKAPRQYILGATKHNLRHRIMAARLGLR